MDFKELCELIEKNQVSAIKFEKGMNFSVTLDDKEICEFSIKGLKDIAELTELKKRVAQNTSIQKVTIESFFVDEDLKFLLEGLQVKQMTSLSLMKCDFDAKNIKYLSELLASTSTLVSFALQPRGLYGTSKYMYLAPDSEVFDALSKILLKNINLKNLSLIGCLHKENLKSVSDMISSCKELSNLDLSENDLQWSLPCLFASPNKIREVSLSPFYHEAAELSKKMLENQSIQKLTIAQQYYNKHNGAFNFKNFQLLLENKSITTLDFQCIIPEASNMKSFLETLEGNRSLVDLSVGGNRFLNGYQQAVAVQVLKKRGVFEGPLKKILSFLMDNKAVNERAYNSYYIERRLIKSTPKAETTSHIMANLKKQDEERRQMLKEAWNLR